MTVLPDTSIWVEYLRKGQKGSAWPLDDLLRLGDVVVCGPVVAELIAGRRKVDRSTLWTLLRALPWAPMGQEDWYRVGELAASLRERGMSVPLTDLEIAVCAVGAHAELWTRDSDFQRIAVVLPELKQYPEAI